MFSDPLWDYSGHDRKNKLIEKSRYYAQLEIDESRKEAETGKIDTNPAYGSEMSSQRQFVREIRDNKVMTTKLGRSFMNEFNQFYYSFSPSVDDYERKNPIFKGIVKIGITPMLLSLSIVSASNSEQEILGLGIRIILMNVRMYLIAPVVIIYKIKKYLELITVNNFDFIIIL